jgi:HD domain
MRIARCPRLSRIVVAWRQADDHEMLRLSIHRARPGMRIAIAVPLPERPEHILLKPGAELDDATIRALIEFGVHAICVQYPPTDFLLRSISPAVLTAQASLAARVMQCIDRVASTRHADFDYLSYGTSVRALISALVDEPTSAVFIENIVEAGEPAVAHSFNVGVLSLMMGLRLDGYLMATRRRTSIRRTQSVENLGVAGLFHDIGMLRLKPEVVARWHATQDERDLDWREHVLLGYDMVKGRIPPTASAAVVHHHQRLDGGGFPKMKRLSGTPQALEGRGIHVFARVVAVADVFDRARAPSVGSPQRVPTVRALRRTLEQVRAGRLDPVAFRALLSIVPAFAPGSVVTLSDRQSYIVTGWHAATPCQPVVSRLPIPAGSHDADLAQLDPERPLDPPIDLRARSDLWVVHAEQANVESELFNPAFAGEFDLRAPFPESLISPIDPWQSTTAPPIRIKQTDDNAPAPRKPRRKAS